MKLGAYYFSCKGAAAFCFLNNYSCLVVNIRSFAKGEHYLKPHYKKLLSLHSAGALSSPHLSPCTCAPWAASAVRLRFRFGGAHLCLGPAHAPPIVQIVVVSAEEVVWACGRDALENISDGREARVAGSLVVERAARDKIQLWPW